MAKGGGIQTDFAGNGEVNVMPKHESSVDAALRLAPS